jgi:uncharacterized protein YbjT (DUF2867 family)
MAAKKQAKPAKKKKVLVAGATGHIGGRVLEGLHDNGYWTRALVRGDRSRLARPECADDVYSGEATKAETIRGLCEGVDVVFSSLGFHSAARKPTIWEIDFGANMNIFKEAEKAGVKHFVFITTVRGEKMAKYSPIADARERVATAIKQSGMDYTIIRPTGFFNDMTYNFDMAAKSGKIWLIGDPYVRMNPLNGLDLADEIIKSIEDPKQRNIERDVGGPEIFTRKEICEMIFEVLDKPVVIKHVPVGVLSVMAKVLKPFHYNVAALAKFLEFTFKTPDMTGERCGFRTLREHFDEHAREMGLSD